MPKDYLRNKIFSLCHRFALWISGSDNAVIRKMIFHKPDDPMRKISCEEFHFEKIEIERCTSKALLNTVISIIHFSRLY